MDSLHDIIQRFKNKGTPLEGEKEFTTPVVEKGIKLKYWPNEVACLPNEWVRSGLFAVTNKLPMRIHPLTGEKERLYVVKKDIPTFSENVKLTYTGFELNQFDQKVYLTAIREAKTQYLECIVQMTANEFCEAGHFSTGGATTKAVKQSLERLFQSNLKSELFKDVSGQKSLVREYHDHLINHYSVDKNTGRWNIALSARLAAMYQFQTSWIDWATWHQVKGDIAKAMMLQVCSHEAPPNKPQKIQYPMLKNILRIDSPIRRLRFRLKKSGDELLEKGVVQTWECKPDYLTFTRRQN